MDRYEKGPILGEGTFGIVFKATQKEVPHFQPFSPISIFLF